MTLTVPFTRAHVLGVHVGTMSNTGRCRHKLLLGALAAPGSQIHILKPGEDETAIAGGFFVCQKCYTSCMKQGSSEIGTSGEKIAADYLSQNGYEILEMNFQNDVGYRVGEIDIIAREKETGEIVFVEVKARIKGGWNSENPELAITRAKFKKLTRIISRFLREKKMEDAPHRLDAIAIEMDMGTRKATLRHLKYIYY
jgi:putative endonuclease